MKYKSKDYNNVQKPPSAVGGEGEAGAEKLSADGSAPAVLQQPTWKSIQKIIKQLQPPSDGDHPLKAFPQKPPFAASK